MDTDNLFLPEQMEKIMWLFDNLKQHVFSQAHFNIVWHWCQVNTTFQHFESCVKFLETVWEEPTFHPFENQQSSEQLLLKDRRHGFLIRLSSQPGKITASKKQTQGIIHSRYFITENGSIKDTQGNCYENLSKLVAFISGGLAVYSRFCQPVGCVSNVYC